jgi:hypothetical protein
MVATASLSRLAGKPGRRKGRQARRGDSVFFTGNRLGGVSWSAAHARFADAFQSVLPNPRSAARERGRETCLSSRALAYLAKETSRWVRYHASPWPCVVKGARPRRERAGRKGGFSLPPSPPLPSPSPISHVHFSSRCLRRQPRSTCVLFHLSSSCTTTKVYCMKPIKANYPIAILPIMTAITFRPGCVCLLRHTYSPAF